ncbi:MAG: hypothetical protein ABSH48_27235, partial [Verrucomicrobiota bacterium]
MLEYKRTAVHENLVWSAKEVDQRKADRLPQEAELKLLTVPRAPKELPVSAMIRKPWHPTCTSVWR